MHSDQNDDSDSLNLILFKSAARPISIGCHICVQTQFIHVCRHPVFAVLLKLPVHFETLSTCATLVRTLDIALRPEQPVKLIEEQLYL